MNKHPFSFLRGLTRIDGDIVDKALQELRMRLIDKGQAAQCVGNPSASLAFNEATELVDLCRDMLAMADRE